MQGNAPRSGSARISTRPLAKRCVGLNVTSGRLHITPTDIGHQAFRTPPISANPGAEASPQQVRRVALGVDAAAQQRPA